MKKILTIAFCIVSISTYAQQFRLGGAIAPTGSFWLVEGDNYIPTGTRIGFQLGGIADLSLGENERFALQSGLNFTSAPGGFEDNPVGLNSNGKTWDFNVTTLDLPILLRLRSDELGKVVLFAQYGVTLGFTMSSKIIVNDDKQGGENFEYQGANTSLTMGAGLEYALSDDMSLLFNAFFQNGVKDMVINNLNQNNDSRYYPQQIGLRAGILF